VGTGFTSWHVGVAAEAFAAGLFARCGVDVSVQYGANQPEYDLIIKRGDKLLPVSVKGSQDGAWGLTQSYLRNANYHQAADAWLLRYGSKTIFCFVQFHNVSLLEMPRVYLATPQEVAQRLKESAMGRGETILYEEHRWNERAFASGTVDRIPPEWCFSLERLDYLFESVSAFQNDAREMNDLRGP